MIPMTVAEIADAVGGRVVDVSADQAVAGPVVVDSRAVVPGSVFACLVGERLDGHDFAAAATSSGAVLALADREVGVPAVVVEDTVKALGRLAAAVLARAERCRVVGVTGSSGKTSTKDLLASVLATQAPTVAPAGSFNNEIGLPLTVLRIEASTRYLVLEYSARGTGHIAYLAGIARPDVAIELNVGRAHLGEFGSPHAIATAKAELVEALSDDGVAVLNTDDPLVEAMATRTRARIVRYGEGAAADVRIEGLRLDAVARPRFRLVSAQGGADVALRLSGRHQAGNAAAVAATALAEGMTLDAVAAALNQVDTLSPHRMHLMTRDDGLLVVDDAYNANPESTRAALDALVALGTDRPGRTWAVLGQMRELGADAQQLHAEVGRYAATIGVEQLVVVGEASGLAEGAASVGEWAGTVTLVRDADEAVDVLSDRLRPDDTLLVKASNTLELWRVAEAVVRQPVMGPA
jgi:UDP-N-acetylmuramoyl-tripeptide--D-alanyl-D-alanine ligase